MIDQEPMTLSGLQHFAYCRRQWALNYIEHQWKDNYFTADGIVFHERAHEGEAVESRGDLLIMRGLRVRSAKMNLVGVCDVVEFHRDEQGVTLAGREGTWRPYPVEYKRGRPKEHKVDELQLCAQAMCLEEMLACAIPEGSLYYGQTRRRHIVAFSEELRQRVSAMVQEMHALFDRGRTPIVRIGKQCTICSVSDLCLPELQNRETVREYIARHLRQDAD